MTDFDEVITERLVSDKIDRRQYVGYKQAGYGIKGGSRIGFVTFSHTGEQQLGHAVEGRETTERLAWYVFWISIKEWMDMKGFVLWRKVPEVVSDDRGYYVTCRLAVSEDDRFLDSKNFV